MDAALATLRRKQPNSHTNAFLQEVLAPFCKTSLRMRLKIPMSVRPF